MKVDGPGLVVVVVVVMKTEQKVGRSACVALITGGRRL